MSKLQKKSLQHVSDLLKSYDTYPTYKALNDILDELQVDNTMKHRILNKYQDEIRKETSKISQSKEWLDTVISDIDEN
jgi:hypothetical protein